MLLTQPDPVIHLTLLPSRYMYTEAGKVTSHLPPLAHLFQEAWPAFSPNSFGQYPVQWTCPKCRDPALRLTSRVDQCWLPVFCVYRREDEAPIAAHGLPHPVPTQMDLVLA